MNGHEEKRRHQRAKVSLPLKISSFKGGTVSLLGSSAASDISEGGISSHVPQFVQMAKRLMLEMDIPGTQTPARAIAKVAWIGKESDGEGYRVGLQFLDSDKKDKETLAKYMSSVILPQGV
jgi:hypothetical protein